MSRYIVLEAMCQNCLKMEKRHYIERNHNFCTLIAKHSSPVDVLTNPYAISWKKKTFVQPPDYQNEIQDYLDSYDYQNQV